MAIGVRMIVISLAVIGFIALAAAGSYLLEEHAEDTTCMIISTILMVVVLGGIAFISCVGI